MLSPCRQVTRPNPRNRRVRSLHLCAGKPTRFILNQCARTFKCLCDFDAMASRKAGHATNPLVLGEWHLPRKVCLGLLACCLLLGHSFAELLLLALLPCLRLFVCPLFDLGLRPVWSFLRPLSGPRASFAELLLPALLPCLCLLSDRGFVCVSVLSSLSSGPLSAPWASFALVASPCSAPLSVLFVLLLCCLLR